MALFNRKKQENDSPPWVHFQKRCRYSSHFRGYKIKGEHISHTQNSRLDYVGYNERNHRDRIVADAKWKKYIVKWDVQKLINNARYPHCARKKVLFVTKNAKVANSAKDLAEKKAVKIQRMGVSKTKPKRKMIDKLMGKKLKPNLW